MSNVPVVQDLKGYFASHEHDLVCAYLYGSVARGSAGPESDIDIAVLYKEDPPRTLDGLGLDLGARLESQLGRPVDLVVLNRVSVDLIHRVLRDGVLLYEGNRSSRIRFEVKARNEYFDLLPYLRQYRRAAAEPQP